MEITASELKYLLDWSYERGKQRAVDDEQLRKDLTIRKDNTFSQPIRAVPEVSFKHTEYSDPEDF